MKVVHLIIEGENVRKVGDVLCDSLKGSFPEKPHIYRTNDMIKITRECYYKELHITLISTTTLHFIDFNKVEIEIICGGAKHIFIDLDVENRENRRVVNNIIDICNENLINILSIEPQDITKTFAKKTIDKFKSNFKSLLNIKDN